MLIPGYAFDHLIPDLAVFTKITNNALGELAIRDLRTKVRLR